MFENIPESLKDEALFVLWKYEERDGKTTKVPYQINGNRASSSNKNTFSSFDQVMTVAGNYDGIGMGAFDDFAMIDIDDCIIDGKLSDMAQDIVDTIDSYTEASPSGTGIRIICKAQGLQYDTNRYYINCHAKGLEIYVAGITKKFCTLTGNVIHNACIENRCEETMTVLEKYMIRPTSLRPFSEIDWKFPFR